MQFPSVNWHEGLFLQPHHFQAWDRHWTERISAGEQWQNPFSYGISEIAINSAALATGYIQLDSLKARTPGGTLLELASGQQSERRDLRTAVSKPWTSPAEASEQVRSTIDIFIGVPRLRLGGSNVTSDKEGAGSRFLSEAFEFPDETDGSSIQPVELRRINAQVLIEGDDLAGYDALPIARARLSPDGSSFELDPNYVPPLVDCGAWPAFRAQILSPIGDLLLRASEQAGRALADAGKTLLANSPLQLQRLVLLQAVNPAAALLRVMTTSRGIHPMTAYLQLVQLAGTLDIFLPQRSVKETKAYDHENLGPLFLQLKQRIVTALAAFDSQPYYQKYLVGKGFGLQTSIDHTPKNGQGEWFIGINKGKLPAEVLKHLLAPGNLDWKIGSAQQVEWMFTQRAPGVELLQVSELPAVLPRGSEWAYYKIRQGNPAWDDVMQTKTLAIRLQDALIANLDSLEGSKKIAVRYKDQTVELQFAIFSVH